MREWKFYCLICKEDVSELVPVGHVGSMKRGVCLACSKNAVAQLGAHLMTVCIPCQEAGRLQVPAMRFVPRAGRNIPMCEACWGGGNGPGMNPPPKPHAFKDEEVLPKHFTDEPKKESTASAPKKLCLCGCKREPQPGRDYCWGHKGQKSTPAPAEVVAAKPAESAARRTIVTGIDDAIAHLRTQRAKLDEAIKILEELRA